MAGIGFELKRLFNNKSVYGYSKAFSYTIMVTLGPFILMIMMVLSIQILLKLFNEPQYVSALYIVSIMYAFIFSHLLSSGFAILATRYVSDKIYMKKYGDILPSMYGIIAMACLCAAVLGIVFFYFAKLSIAMKIITFTFFMQMIVLWINGVYLSALKDFMKIVRCYSIGVLTIIITSTAVFYLDVPHLVLAILLCMNIGVFVINILLLTAVKSYFHTNNGSYFAFLPYFDSHGSLVIANFALTLGMYIPNFIIWFSEMQLTVADTYICAPKYDAATFCAFISSMTVMIMFVVVTETNFYVKYARYFNYITNKGNATDIASAKKEMVDTMWMEIRNIFEFQLVITLFCIVMGNYILPMIGLDYESIVIYQILAAGAYASSLMQLMIILLIYFEDRQGAMLVSLIFLFFNFVFNLICVQLGRNTFGMGFFLASLIGLLISINRLSDYIKNINYYVFCCQPVYYQIENGLFTKIYRKIANM